MDKKTPAAIVAMVVDDNAGGAYLAGRLLKEAGVTHVLGALSAKDALLQVRRHPPDLVLVDLHLPDDDGFSLGQNLRKVLPQAVLLLTSARTPTGFEVLDPIFQAFLEQPLDRPENRPAIEAAIAEVIERRKTA